MTPQSDTTQYHHVRHRTVPPQYDIVARHRTVPPQYDIVARHRILCRRRRNLVADE